MGCLLLALVVGRVIAACALDRGVVTVADHIRKLVIPCFIGDLFAAVHVGDSSIVEIVLRKNRAGTQRYAVELELAQRGCCDNDVLALCSTVVLIGIRQMSVCI